MTGKTDSLQSTRDTSLGMRTGPGGAADTERGIRSAAPNTFKGEGEGLATGEATLVEEQMARWRPERRKIHLWEFGDGWFPWSEAGAIWGAGVGRRICQTHRLEEVRRANPGMETATLETVLQEDRMKCWSGVLAGLVRTPGWGRRFGELLNAAHPRVCLVALPGTITRKEARDWLPQNPECHHMRMHALRHRDLGGGTTSRWEIAVHQRLVDLETDAPMRFELGSYPRTLEMATDDTTGGPGGRHEGLFEDVKVQPSEVLEHRELPLGFIGNKASEPPALDGQGLAWDFSEVLEAKNLSRFYARAPTVFTKEWAVRPLQAKEILALWDCPVCGTEGLERVRADALKKTRGPPGKIVRGVLYSVLGWLMADRFGGDERMSDREIVATTGTARTAVATVEELTSERHQRATKADDEPVDESVWALPNETEEQAKARTSLRKFAHAFWLRKLKESGENWVKEHGNHRHDRAALAECLVRGEGSDWFKWLDGSRLFFWRWGEWARDARDGIPFWHLREPDTWRGRNFPAPAREAELKLREKELQLWGRRCLEPGFVRLMVCRFGVEKLDDMRAVWDSK